MGRVREAPKLVKIGVPIVLVLVIVGAAAGGGGNSSSSSTAGAQDHTRNAGAAGTKQQAAQQPSSSGNSKSHSVRKPLPATEGATHESSPAERREAARQADQKAAIELKESIMAAIDTDDTPSVLCAGQTNCGVTYEIEELAGIDTDEELLNAQRDVWEAMFADPKFQSGFIELEGQVETAGGKSLTEPILRVRCSRAAARQIDWSNVRPEGFKQLCRWEELVNF